jgi:hypothetical protein
MTERANRASPASAREPEALRRRRRAGRMPDVG